MRNYWRFLRTHAKEYAPDIAAGVLLAAVYTAMSLVTPLLTRTLVDNILTTRSESILTRLVLVMVAVLVVSAVLVLAFNAIVFRNFQRVGFGLKARVFDHLTHLDMADLNEMPVGTMTYRLFGDTDSLQGSLMRMLLTLSLNTLMMVFVTLSMIWLNARLAVVVLIILFAQGAVVASLRGKLQRYATDRKKAGEVMYSRAVEVLGAVPLVRSCGTEAVEADRFQANLARVQRISLRESLLNIGSGAISGIITGMISFSVLWYGGLQVMRGVMTLGGLTAFLMIANMVSAPVTALANVVLDFPDAEVSTRRLFEMLDKQAQVRSQEGAPAPELQGQIEVRNVAFGYPHAPAILRNVTFDVPPRSILSIIGRSGMGKSTICALLARFYDPLAGEILVDGHDLRNLDLTSYRHQVGLVLQNSFLFSGTVRENILLGKPDASNDELFEAARKANAHEFISQLPDGYWTTVGERGTRLSGGEAQRIALARLFLQDPRIVILDEATSFVDLESEACIHEAIKRLAERSTVIIITHRLATAKLASHIAVLDGGTVAEFGTHEELLMREGVYARLYRRVLS